jgi:hypothetical protein
MTPFKGLKDDEIAAVRAATKDQPSFYSPAELLKQHPDQ